MPAKKPTAGLRTRKPLSAREENIEIERIARKLGRPNTELEERPARGIVKRAGRQFADGRSSPAGQLRRLAVYIPIELFDELEARARAARRTLSETTAATLADQFGITLEATG